MASIEFQSVFKAYGNHAPVIRNVDLRVDDGEFCVFVGPSGCGKSTLLRMLAGLEDISSGELRINGQRMNDTPSALRGVAMVFQNYALFPHMSVYENISFGLSINKVDKATIDAKVKQAAKVLQLEHLLDRKPKALSGGQRQRVAIGRAIVREPGVFLFDEPLSNLDAALRVQTRLEIARLHKSYGRASMVYVTHDQVEAMTLADRILLLNTGEAVAKDGSVAQYGTPLELYHRPANLFVAGFIGSPKMNFFEAKLEQSGAQTSRLTLSSGEVLQAHVDTGRLAAGARVTVGVRPEHVRLGNATQHITREVSWQERLGDVTYLYLDAGVGHEGWVVKADGNVQCEPGTRIAVSLPAQDIHVFDDSGQALPRVMAKEPAAMPVHA
jgi:multiple sugar transport system ATP-binding protein